jgi:hypothetical protein
MEQHHAEDGDEPKAVHLRDVAMGRGGDPLEAGDIHRVAGWGMRAPMLTDRLAWFKKRPFPRPFCPRVKWGMTGFAGSSKRQIG